MSRINDLKFGDILVATQRFRPFLGLIAAILLVTVVLPLKSTVSGAGGSGGRISSDEQPQESVEATVETTEVPAVTEQAQAPGALPDQFSSSFYEQDSSSSESSEDESGSAGDEEEEEEEEEPEPEPSPSPIACVPGVACVTPSD